MTTTTTTSRLSASSGQKYFGGSPQDGGLAPRPIIHRKIGAAASDARRLQSLAAKAGPLTM
ncbi:hypothetical protein [Loktanella sp. M215]|uniref:hypothetical protein n=1 Tax=Loktanella sp. M215 TaxID=2675431 RepID=UPI001F385D4B|nr:hypothetical protein [Loktanella sp. M215]